MPRKKRVRLPWMMYFGKDWFSDMALQSCSIGARGLWHEMILYMHAAPTYGHMVNSNGEAITDEKIAALFHVPSAECSVYLVELESATVFSRTCTGIIYSRRMLRDNVKRSLAAKRQRFHRDRVALRHADVTQTSHLGHVKMSDVRCQMSDVIKREEKPTTAQAPPDWLPPEQWQAFKEMRQKIRKPLTQYAERRIIEKLDALRQLGNSPSMVLDQSVCNSWQGVFALREENSNGGRDEAISRRQREADRAAAEAIRRMG